jgi:hypothetical protein
MLALQARPNSFPHSEVDFGTFLWDSVGVALISEFGYGTIGSAVNKFDLRRWEQVDNAPIGHNTVIIREANHGDDEEINYSQMAYERGALPFPSF